MKITNDIKDCRKENIDHLNRIQGQIETLKKYISEDRCCADIAQLTTSVAKSFDTLRTKTLESFICNQLLKDKEVSKKQMDNLKRILNLYKK